MHINKSSGSIPPLSPILSPDNLGLLLSPLLESSQRNPPHGQADLFDFRLQMDDDDANNHSYFQSHHEIPEFHEES